MFETRRGLLYLNRLGMLVVSGTSRGFWSHLGCRRRSVAIFSESFKARLHRRFLSQQLDANYCRNFKIASVNQVRFSVRFVAAISQGFRTYLKLDAMLARQKLHRVAATNIACVNWPLECTRRKINKRNAVI